MTDVYYSVDERDQARDEAEDLREEAWREAHHEGQIDDIQIIWMRRRRPAAIPVSIDEFDQAMRSHHGHMFSD